jgi:hypothetical protein
MNDQRQQGSALLLVVVILLVLSGLGMAMLALTDSDRETVSWNDHVKDALYVAEIGLRVGEDVLFQSSPINASTLMQHDSVSQTAVVTPGIPVFPVTPSQYDLTRLGTYLIDPGGNELANQAVTLPPSPTGRPMPEAFYSLYIRNNPNDPAILDTTVAATTNLDPPVNLVVVAWVAKAGNVLAVKILEEEYTWLGLAEALSSQKLQDSGGTGSGQYGG